METRVESLNGRDGLHGGVGVGSNFVVCAVECVGVDGGVRDSGFGDGGVGDCGGVVDYSFGSLSIHGYKNSNTD